MQSIRKFRSASGTGAQLAAARIAWAEAALSCANGNPGRNTYVWRDEQWTMAEARRAATLEDAPLAGVPVSVKDCFDLAGTPSTLGTKFYRDLNGVAASDSWLVERLREWGAVITGKTHMHPLAYGLTGENPDFGDCLQPGNSGALTGGSSSGAAASVLEGSAAAAIGSDTGGSVRLPAALCGIAGYRASHGRGDWRGAGHLAASFDTFGWLFRDLEDAPILGALYGEAGGPETKLPAACAVVDERFLADCEPCVLRSLRRCRQELEALGLQVEIVDAGWWNGSTDIFAPIQAAEAARNYEGHFEAGGPAIRQRLEWGARLTDAEVTEWRRRHIEFRDHMDGLLARHELLLMPVAPLARLEAGVDHTENRPRLLRYTTPASLSGMPAVTIPFHEDSRPAGGMQLLAAREDDARLLAVAAALGRRRNAATEK